VSKTEASGAGRFLEVQHFRQWWLWLLLVATAAATSGLFARGLYVQLLRGRPWGDSPMPDRALLIFALAVLLLNIALLALFAAANLRTEVREDGLYVRFFPFHLSLRRLPLTDVARVEAVTYSPIGDYGGWGLRYSWGAPDGSRGKAYNVSGNRGVRLTYTTGRHLLIGSQQADQLAAAIEAIREEGGGR